ncbi:MAG: NUDIX hydrolase [Gaiellaceae bacterium]
MVVRTSEDDEVRILVVHRPRYDDWSLPKGKHEPDEADAGCAAREVREETGMSCDVGPQLAEISYRDHKDRPKTVVYFLMEPLGGEFVPNEEVDEVRWVTLGEARELLSYARDADVAQLALTQLQ